MNRTPAQLSNFLPLTAWGYHWWRRHSLSLLAGEPFSLEREGRLFTALAQPKAGERWLDIGSSTGFYAGLLARAGCEVDAVELSPAMRQAGARREPSARIRWLALNGEATGLPAGGYDGVTIGATLNETAHPDVMLKEAARLLRPGGRLWLMYAAETGGLTQALLRCLGGLSFPDFSWVARQGPQLTPVHHVRFGPIEFALLHKENRAPT